MENVLIFSLPIRERHLSCFRGKSSIETLVSGVLMGKFPAGHGSPSLSPLNWEWGGIFRSLGVHRGLSSWREEEEEEDGCREKQQMLGHQERMEAPGSQIILLKAANPHPCPRNSLSHGTGWQQGGQRGRQPSAKSQPPFLPHCSKTRGVFLLNSVFFLKKAMFLFEKKNPKLIFSQKIDKTEDAF